MTGDERRNRRELHAIQLIHLVVWAASTGFAAWRYGERAAMAVGIGGLVAAVNFWLTMLLIRKVVPESGQEASGVASSSGSGAGLVIVKFGGLFGGTGMLLWQVRPDPVGFGVGFCTILMAIVVKAFVDLIRPGLWGTYDDDENGQ